MLTQQNAAYTAACAPVSSRGVAFCCANTNTIFVDAAFAASIFMILVLVCLLPLSGLIMISLLSIIILLTIIPPHGPGLRS